MSDILLTYKYVCSTCLAGSEESFGTGLGLMPPFPSLPEGWRCIEGNLYCPKHEIKVLVDEGKVKR